MNICFFNSVKSWGGGEKWHFEAALEMKKRKHEVHLFTYPNSALFKKAKEKNINISVLKINNFSFTNPFKIKKISTFFSKNNIEIVIINASQDLKIAGLAAKKANVKKIIYRRGSAIPIKNTFLNRYFFGKILTGVIANSEATKNTILQNNKTLIHPKKIKVIYNAINVETYNNKPFQPFQKAKNNQILISNIGRLEVQKNQIFLIDLAAELVERKLNFKIIIAGSGKLDAELKSKVQSKNLTDKIQFLGFIENVKDILSVSDIFMLSSLWEGFGFVLAEASLSKIPIVAFNVSSNPELVLNNETGFLLPVNNLEEVANKIEILIHNKNQRKIMGEKGFQHIKNNFNTALIMDKLEKFLLS